MGLSSFRITVSKHLAPRSVRGVKFNFLDVAWFSLAVAGAELGVASFCPGDQCNATLGIRGRSLAADCSRGEIFWSGFAVRGLGAGAPRCLQEGSLCCLQELCQIPRGGTILLPPNLALGSVSPDSRGKPVSRVSHGRGASPKAGG